MVLVDSHRIPRALCYLGYKKVESNFKLQGCNLLKRFISKTSLKLKSIKILSHNTRRFRLIPVRSPLLRKSRLLSFPSATKMFQFTEFSLSCLWIQQEVLKVFLFGNLWIKICFQLPRAFRRLPRPSSFWSIEVFTYKPL